jgi:prophage tail gpP-like protein
LAERYSQITVVGSSRGSSSNYGRNVTDHKGVAANGSGANGIGEDFVRRKTLILSDGDVKSADDAVDRASREMALRDATGRKLRVTVEGHGQRYNAGTPPTLYACDTMAQVVIPELKISDRYLIVSCQFSCGRDDAELTTLTMVPDQTVLTQ